MVSLLVFAARARVRVPFRAVVASIRTFFGVEVEWDAKPDSRVDTVDYFESNPKYPDRVLHDDIQLGRFEFGGLAAGGLSCIVHFHLHIIRFRWFQLVIAFLMCQQCTIAREATVTWLVGGQIIGDGDGFPSKFFCAP
ncbi:unnamed protein product [Sphagnum balticum]